jgi:hypothetical protein
MTSSPDDQVRAELRPEALVERLVPDPAAPSPSTPLVGFLGRSTEEGRWRLYLTTAFDQYVEFDERDVRHSEPLSSSETSLGGTRVWLRQGASVQHTRVQSRQVQAEFLAGSIASMHLSSAMPSLGTSRVAGALRACASLRIVCDPQSIDVCRTERFDETLNRHIPACQSDGFGCGGGSIGCGDTQVNSTICPSGPFVCGASAGCTPGRECSVGCP